MPRSAEAMRRDAANKRRRTLLASRPVSDKQCEVPGCEGITLINEEDDVTDCCYAHSLQGSDTENTLTNDGIIDWTAIDVAAQGARPVGLTWVEKDIVMAVVLAEGGNITQALACAGAHHQHSGRRAAAIEKIRQALVSTSNRRGC